MIGRWLGGVLARLAPALLVLAVYAVVVAWVLGNLHQLLTWAAWTAAAAVAAVAGFFLLLLATSWWESYARRRRVERLGWPAVIIAHRLRQIGPAIPDPGNPGQLLRLYDVPPGLYTHQRLAVLVAVNGTPDLATGTRQVVGVTVRPGHRDPLDAAAAAAGITRDQYARIAIRT